MRDLHEENPLRRVDFFALDFQSPRNLTRPIFIVPPGPYDLPCVPPDAQDLSDSLDFLSLRKRGLELGFPP